MKKLSTTLLCYSLMIPMYCVAAEKSGDAHKKRIKTSFVQTNRNKEPKQDTPSFRRISSQKRSAIVLAAATEDDQSPHGEVEEPSVCEKEANRFRFSLVHREGKGIGYGTGYSSLDAFLAFTTIHGVTPFFDLRAHMSNDGKPAANAGFGLRYLPKNYNVVLGVNGFFDFREASHTSFEQAGVGLEILGTQWKYFANGYFPLFSRDKIYNAEFYKFSRHSILINMLHETAMAGADTSLARSLFHRGFFDLDMFVGGYYFTGKQDLSAKGGYVKLRSNLSRFFSIEAQGSYDTLFKWIGQGAVALSVPLGKRAKVEGKKRSCYETIALSRNITEPVSRFEMIVTHTTKKTVEALDPRTSTPLHVVFVDNTKAMGDGSAERPYNALNVAEANSAPAEMIYVFAGNGLDTNMNTGITLKDNQWLQGSGVAFNVLTAPFLVNVAAQTNNYPLISKALSSCLTLANNNTVNGMKIRSDIKGIAALDKSSGTLTNNIVESSPLLGKGIDLLDVSGVWNISSNAITSKDGMTLVSDQISMINLLQNTFQNPGNFNLELGIDGSGRADIALKQNIFTSSIEGVTIEISDSAEATIRLTDNTVSNISGPTPPSATSALTIAALDNANITALLARNTVDVSSEIGFAGLSEDSSTAYFALQSNLFTTSSTATTSIGMTVSSLNNSTMTASLNHNSAAGAAQIFLDQNGSSTYFLESPSLSLTGVQSLNPGVITTDGTILFIPYNPPKVK